jgi:hypothetical protein
MSVIVPGGGQSDLWHGLTCKGKYAGEIRIELTYYDTRPKDESVFEKRREAEKKDTDGSPSNPLSGPRQQKQVKRRPLPADPTGSSPARPKMHEQVHSSPMTSARPYDNFEGQHNGPPSYHIHQPSPHSSYSSRYPPNLPAQEMDPHDEKSPGEVEGSYGQDSHRSFHEDYSISRDQLNQDPTFERHSYGPDRFVRQPYVYDEPPARDSYQTPLREDRRYSAEPSFPPHSTTNASPHNYGSSPEYSHPGSALASTGQGERQYQSYNRYSTSPLKNDVFRDSPLRQSVSHNHEEQHGYMQPSVEDDEDTPPPPPAHRNGISSQPREERSYNERQPVPMPAPLNIAPDRKSPRPFGGSDRNMYIAQEQMTTESPTSDYSRSSFLSHSSQSHMARGMLRDFPDAFEVNDLGSNVPPSLTPGFDPAVAESEAERISYETQQNRRYSHIPSRPPVPQNRSDPGYSSIQAQSPYSVPSPTERQPNHGSALMIKPRAVSPDPRAIPPRKSLSPQPAPPPAAEERRLSGIPFSPDSYDTLNPNASAAAAVHQTPFYETPDQAKEAARQREVERLRAVGPIIGNDGREIDPSDHLPADTWAPEPERKAPKKPEVVLRFKNTGTRPQPSPISARPSPTTKNTPTSASRPQSIAAVPVYSHSQPATPPPLNMNHDSPFPILNSTTSTPPLPRQGRNRLQKPNPHQPQPQPYSSPAVPTINTTPTSHNDYQPLRENENYNPQPYHQRGYSYNSSPLSNYPSSPYGATTAPPIPAKIPIQAGNQNYPAYGDTSEMDALSREMSSIDIGSSGGRPGRRIQRGGLQYREV